MKKNGNKGYILFESLVALVMIFILVNGYLYLSAFLLDISRQRQERLVFYRQLYTETKRKVRYAEIDPDFFQRLEFEENNGIQKIVAEKEDEQIVVERY